MRIPLAPCIPFEIVGHRPGHPVSGAAPNDGNPSTLRNYLPVQLRRTPRPAWVNETHPRATPADAENLSAAQVETPAERLAQEVRILKEWVNQGPLLERRARQEVSREFTRCLNNPNETTLTIYNLQRLTSLPPIPRTLTRFVASDCTNLQKPPVLAKGSHLEILIFFRCWSIREAPDVSLCSELKKLILYRCDAITDPPDLSRCPHITALDFSGCTRLAALPDLAPCPELTRLDISNCRALTGALNLSLSPQLTRLDMNNCSGINALSLSGCDQLETVFAQSCTLLQSLPSVGHLQHLRGLHCQATSFTSLPDDIVTLPPHCSFNFDASLLSVVVLNRLDHIMNTPGFNGPQINYSLGLPTAHARARSLDLEVAAWHNEAPLHLQQALTVFDWKAPPRQDNAVAFSTFLARVRETNDYRHATPELKKATQERVAQLLVQLQVDPVLRNDCFNIALDAIGTCGDRVALRFMDMENLAVSSAASAAIDRGKYDNNPQALVEVCKGQHRLAIIAAEAQQKVAGLNLSDPIEVHLGYLTKLAEPCQLPVQIRTMLYPRCARVTDEDIAAARKKLLNMGLSEAECAGNNRAFQEALARSPLMHKLLQRLRSDEKTAANAGNDAQIEKAQTQIRQQMDALVPSEPNYHQQSRQLMDAYNALDDDLPARATRPVLHAFLLAEEIDGGMNNAAQQTAAAH